MFRLNAEVYPGLPGPHATLGNAYSEAGRLKEALESYQRAVAVAEAANHPDLSSHRANLQRVMAQIAQPK